MCIRVDLPEPDGPMIAREAAALEADADADQGVDGGVALAVAAGDVGGHDDLSVRAHSASPYRLDRQTASTATR